MNRLTILQLFCMLSSSAAFLLKTHFELFKVMMVLLAERWIGLVGGGSWFILRLQLTKRGGVRDYRTGCVPVEHHLAFSPCLVLIFSTAKNHQFSQQDMYGFANTIYKTSKTNITNGWGFAHGREGNGIKGANSVTYLYSFRPFTYFTEIDNWPKCVIRSW